MLRRLLLIAERVLIVVLLSLAVLFAGDSLYVRYRMLHPKADDPFEVVEVLPLYSYPVKGGKNEYVLSDTPVKQSCVHSLFPHAGYNPCWYVKRQSQKPILLVEDVPGIQQAHVLDGAMPSDFILR